jgi:excisionase family DNA binding protein
MQKIEKNGYNVREAAKYIGVSPPTFLKLLDEIPHRRVGKRVIIGKTNLDNWLNGSVQK